MRARLFALALLAGAPFVLSAAFGQPAVPPVPGAQPPVILRPPSDVTQPALPVAPQAAPAQQVHGVIQQFDGPFLTLKTTDRKIVTLGMTTATRIVHQRILPLTDLAPGGFASVAALKGADGKLRALGVRLYPATGRLNEGQYPLDAGATRILTNGTIAGFVPGGSGGMLAVNFHGAAPDATGQCTGRAPLGGLGCTGQAQFQIARGVPVISMETGDISLLLTGAAITVSAAPDANGTLVALSLTVEKDAPAPRP